MNCGFCLREKDYKSIRPALFKKILIQARKQGYDGISITGGEPCLHSDFYELIDMTARDTFDFTIVSNGYNYEKYIHLLRYEKSFKRITFSLDAGSAKVHDVLRGKGSFKRVTEAVKYFSDKIDVHTSICLNRFNVSEIGSFVRLSEKLGAKRAKFLGTIPTGKNENYSLSDKERIECCETIDSLRGKTGIDLRVFGSLSAGKGIDFCRALNLTDMAVNPKGEFIFCCDTAGNGAVLGSLKKQSLPSLIKKGEKFSEFLREKRALHYQNNEFFQGFNTCIFCNKYLKRFKVNEVECKPLKALREIGEGIQNPSYQMTKYDFAKAEMAMIVLLLTSCTFMKADMNFFQGDYQNAIPLYQKYLAHHPDAIDCRNKIGFAFLKSGRLDEAEKTFTDVLSLDEDNSYAILYLGLTYLNKEEYRKALTTWQAYRNEEQPLVEDEIKRLMTVVQIADSYRMARQALSEEAILRARTPESNTIAVCCFEDLSPDGSLHAFGKALAAMLITDLSKIRSLSVVSRLNMEALTREMKLGQKGIVDKKTAPRVGHLIGASHLVVGNLSGSITAVTSTVGTSQGAIKGSTAIDVAQEHFYQLPSHIINAIAKIQGITLTQQERKAIGIPHTTVYEAFICYGQALNAIDEGRWEDARNLFQKALSLDPAFDLASEGADTTPAADTPSLESIAVEAPQALNTHMEQQIDAVEAASEAQGEADSDDGGGGSCCFPAGTKVMMADKSLKNIEDVKVGDKVVSFDVEKKEKINAEVLKLESPVRDHICTLHFKSGKKLELTSEHPVFTKKGWKSVNPEDTLKDNASMDFVEKLEIGDEALMSDGSYDGIADITREETEIQTYNLKEVSEQHNFFADDVLVHNKGGGG